MNDRGILASHLLSLVSKIITPENSSQFKLVKDPKLNRFNDFLIDKTIAETLYHNLLTFRDIEKKFELIVDEKFVEKKRTKNNHNVDLANLSDKKLLFEL